MIFLEHVGIAAKNSTALKDWFVKLFNWKVVYDDKKERPTYLLLLEDKRLIEIYPSENETGYLDTTYQGIRHVSLGTDNIEDDFNNLLKNNVEIISGIKGDANKVAFFKDPEGNIYHFIQREKSIV